MIVGTREQLEMARQMITDTVKEHTADPDEDDVTVTVKVPSGFYKHILGEPGKNLRSKAAVGSLYRSTGYNDSR